MKYEAYGDRVIARRVEADEKVGSLFVPDAARKKSTRCVVVSVGPGKAMPALINSIGRLAVDAPSIAEGDEILIADYSGHEFQEDGKTFVIVSVPEILAVFHGAYEGREVAS